jgi:hypothetical protein
MIRRVSKLHASALMLSVLMLVGLIGAESFPVVSGFHCQIQIGQLEYPTNLNTSQNLQVKSRVTVTCTTTMIELEGRVDLADPSTNQSLSSAVFRVGYVSEPERTMDFVLLNNVTAPSTPTTWMLRVDALLFAGSGVLVTSTSQALQVQVGLSSPTLIAIVALVAILVVIVLIVLFRRRGPRRQRRTR